MLAGQGMDAAAPAGYFVASGVDSLAPEPSPLDYERLTQAAEARTS